MLETDCGKCDPIWLTWLQDFNDNSLVRERVNSFVNLRVLSSTDLLDDLVVVLGSAQQYQSTTITVNLLEFDFEVLVVGVIRNGSGHLPAHIRVVPGRHVI
jgi:hypothetical protein